MLERSYEEYNLIDVAGVLRSVSLSGAVFF